MYVFKAGHCTCICVLSFAALKRTAIAKPSAVALRSLGILLYDPSHYTYIAYAIFDYICCMNKFTSGVCQATDITRPSTPIHTQTLLLLLAVQCLGPLLPCAVGVWSPQCLLHPCVQEKDTKTHLCWHCRVGCMCADVCIVHV